MLFYSILYPQERDVLNSVMVQPECLSDLHLDQFFRYIFDSKRMYELEEFYYTTQKDNDVILYRQDVFKDLQNKVLFEAISTFSRQTGLLSRDMNHIRVLLSGKSRDNNLLTKGQLLNRAVIYCNALDELFLKLKPIEVKSKGLSSFKYFLMDYCNSNEFGNLKKEVQEMREAFDNIKYCLYIRNNFLRVSKYDNEESITDEINELFQKFRQDSVRDYSSKLMLNMYDNRIETEVLAMNAKLYPQEFKRLEKFCKDTSHFDNDIILRFSREIQFYISWIEETELLRKSNLPFCFPTLTNQLSNIHMNDFYDIMLAAKQPSKIVTNSVYLENKENVLVITGPNQGGKTTFARSYGQLHYLASLGFDVPGSEANLLLIDQVLTHFEKEESIDTLNGKLQDELERLYVLKQKATNKSLILINEIFASTTTQDAIQLGNHMMGWLVSLGAPAIVVTFLDELASYSENVVSMMGQIYSEENHERTYKILRKSADGHAYAMDIAKKYGLTKEELERRLSK